jgi:hypothetical protein
MHEGKEQRTQIRSVAGEVWGIICGMGFGVEVMFFPRISIGTAIHGMYICHFPSRGIRFRYKTTKRISNQMSITTPTIYHCFFFISTLVLLGLLSLSRHKQGEGKQTHTTHFDLLMHTAMLS